MTRSFHELVDRGSSGVPSFGLGGRILSAILCNADDTVRYMQDKAREEAPTWSGATPCRER